MTAEHLRSWTHSSLDQLKHTDGDMKVYKSYNRGLHSVAFVGLSCQLECGEGVYSVLFMFTCTVTMQESLLSRTQQT